MPKKIAFYTAGYHQQRGAIPPNAVNIARRASNRWTSEGTGRSIGCLMPLAAVFAAAKRPGGDWKAEYTRQLQAAYRSGKLSAAVAKLKDGDVLMCWEKDARDCHRLIAAEFITTHFPQVRYLGEYWEVMRKPKDPRLSYW